MSETKRIKEIRYAFMVFSVEDGWEIKQVGNEYMCQRNNGAETMSVDVNDPFIKIIYY